MPRQISDQQYATAKSKVESILSSYGPIDTLRSNHDRYVTSRDSYLRIYFKKYRALSSWQKKIDLYEEQHRGFKCANCSRKQSHILLAKYGEDSPYFICYSAHSTLGIRKRRPFKFVSSTSSVRNARNVLLCEECVHHIVLEEDYDTACDSKYSWPGFMYGLLSNKDIHDEYGDHIWRFFPTQWRYWWLDTARSIPCLSSVTIELPPPIFIDKTIDITKWNDAISCYDLAQLRDVCNDLLIPTVLCPFGCTEYAHRCGLFPLDLIIQRYLPRCIIKPMHKLKGFNKIIPARDDYVREDNLYDKLLFNPAWKVQPCIYTCDTSGASVLTCRNHKDGEKLFIIHMCRQPTHILPSPTSDQLSHCVIKPRLIKPMKASAYSTEFQMHEQRGTFNGIDTFSVTEFGRFDICSLLLAESEARTLSNRPDINALLTDLVKKGVLTQACASSRRSEARRLSHGIDYRLFEHGATYVPIHVAISFHREQVEQDLSAEDSGVPIFFHRCWPLYTFPCQKSCNYGAMIPCIPSFDSATSNTLLMWYICSLMVCIERLWYIVATSDLDITQWNGWFLVFLSRTCFNNIQRRQRQDKRDPFKFSQVRSTNALLDKLNATSLDECFSDISSVRVLTDVDDIGGVVPGLIDADIDSVVLLSGCYSNDDDISDLPMTFSSGDTVYELRYVCQQHEVDNDGNKWNTNVYCRHGLRFNEWWYQKRHSSLSTHSSPPVSLEHGIPFLLAFVRLDKEDLKSLGSEFLKYIGGQSHVRCRVHRMPLIFSCDRILRCFCGRKEHYRCPSLSCSSCICKRCCSNASNDEEITFVSPTEGNDSLLSDNVSSLDEDIIRDRQEDAQNDNDGDMIFGTDNNILLEHDDFDHFVTSSPDPDLPNFGEDLSDDEFNFEPIPSTNAGEFSYQIRSETISKGMTISGHVLTNQCGTCLARKVYQIKGSSKHKFFLQRICSSTLGSSIPLLYPEATIFPSIFWKTADTAGSVYGAIPSPLLTEDVRKFGFASIFDTIRGRLKSCSSSTSTNPNYIAFSFDTMTNISVNHSDTRIALRRGLTASEDSSGGLGVRNQAESSLLGSIDSKQAVRNLCASQKYHQMDFFVTFTCNHSKHFGVSPIRNWIDSKSWEQECLEIFGDITEYELEEIEKAIRTASAPLILQNWQETCTYFLSYLKHSPTSPFLKLLSFFARLEYQKEAGNLSHTHAILQLDRRSLTDEDLKKLNDLIRANVVDVIRPDEVDDLVKNRILKDAEEYHYVLTDVRSFLTHRCSPRCLINLGDGNFRCRKLNIFSSPDTTKHVMKPLPCNFSSPCIDRLIQIGIVETLCITTNGYQAPFKSHMPFFHPVRHIPPTNASEPTNISPCEGVSFAVCRSMQNVQLLTECGGVNTYVCKYIGKIDDNNYVVAKPDKTGHASLISRAQFLHNTKISTSKANDEKDKEARGDNKKPQGRAVSEMEMLHHMLRYPEVVTDLEFIQIDTVAPDMRRAVPGLSANLSRGTHTNNEWVDNSQWRSHLPQWRQFSESDLQILENIRHSKCSVNRISQFSLRPPELRHVFCRVGDYFRWFSISEKRFDEEEVPELLKPNLEESIWIDGFHHAIRLRHSATDEVSTFLESQIWSGEDNDVVHLFCRILRVLEAENDESSSLLDNSDAEFLEFTSNMLIDDTNKDRHLPVPVFSYIRPTLGVPFLLHLLLSMGKFRSEIDLCLQPSFREAFRTAKLIGESNDPNILQTYSNTLLRTFIEEQLQYFPKSKRVIDNWIVCCGSLLDSVIVHDAIPITDIPPYQFTSLFGNDDAESPEVVFCSKVKASVVTAALLELDNSVELCNIPSRDSLLRASSDNPLDWDPVQSYTRSPNQAISSFNEQRFAISECCKTILSYTDILRQKRVLKSIGIRGFPGSGKTWIMMYLTLYAFSQGLRAATTAMMAQRAVQLGGKHWHHFFHLPFDQNQSPHQIAEFALAKLAYDGVRSNLLCTLDILFCDEMGQVPSDFLEAIDIILRRIRQNNLFLGGLLIVCTLDHTQLQPVNGRPFLTSVHVIPCFKMVALETSVRASDDQAYQRLQAICRYNYKKLKNEPHLIEEFVNLASEILTFVPTWTDEEITPNTFRLYSRKIPAKQAARDFVERVQRLVPPASRRERLSDDVMKNRFSHQDWLQASEQIATALDTCVREPQHLLFFRGALYEFTYNVDGVFSQAQAAVLFDLPTEDDLRSWKKVKVLAAPPGVKDLAFDLDAPKQYYLDLGFEEVKVGVAPERSYNVKSNIQAQRRQYGIKHRVTSTIHAAMGDTLIRLATEVSRNNPDFNLWDKGQLVVVLSRTKLARNCIFVGDKCETLAVFKEILLKKTQWSDFIEDVLDVVTVNPEGNEVVSTTLTQSSFPYRVCDVVLPQCRTGFVYMLISLKDDNFCFFGETNSLRDRIQRHNSGYGNDDRNAVHLRPFALMAYICGFEGQKNLRKEIMCRWKDMKSTLYNNGEVDRQQWALSGEAVIEDVANSHFVSESFDLKLVCLFRPNPDHE